MYVDLKIQHSNAKYPLVNILNVLYVHYAVISWNISTLHKHMLTSSNSSSCSSCPPVVGMDYVVCLL